MGGEGRGTACVASVSVEFSTVKSRFSLLWTRPKQGESKHEEDGEGGRGRGGERGGEGRELLRLRGGPSCGRKGTGCSQIPNV